MKINIADFEIEGIDQIIKDTGDLVAKQNELRNSNKAILKDTENLTNATQAQRNAYVQNTAQIKQSSTQISTNNKLLQAQTQTQREVNDALSRNTDSIDKARASTTELTKIRNTLNLNTKEGVAQAERLNKQIDENNEFVKNNVSQLEEQKIGIGGYTEGIKEAFAETSGFNSILGRLSGIFGLLKPLYAGAKQDLSNVSSGFKDAANNSKGLSVAQRITAVTTGGVSAALKLLKIAIAATGIGVLLLAIGSLITFLTSTQKGIDAVNKVLIPLQAVFETLVGLFQQAGEALFDAFNNPRKTLNELADFIANQFTKRIQGLGNILKGLVTLNFDSIKEGVKQISDANNVIIDGIKGVATQVSGAIAEAIERGKEVAALQVQIEQGENNLILLRAESLRTIKEENKVAEDVTRTIQDREASAANAIKLSTELLAEEQKILDLKIRQLQIQQENNDTSREDEAELNGLIAERADKETQALELQTTLTNKLNIIRREAAAAATKRATDAIKQTEQDLQLFIATEDQKNLKISERLKTIQDVENAETAIQQSKLDAQLINQTEFELAILGIKQKSLEDQANLTIENLNQELDLFKANNQSKIDESNRLTQSLVDTEINRLTTIFNSQQEILTEQREAGLISELEFKAIRQNQLNEFDEEQRAIRQEFDIQQEEEAREKEALDFEEKRIRDEGRNQSSFDVQLANIERDRILQTQEAERNIQNEELLAQAKNNIDARAAQASLKIEEARANAKIQAQVQVLDAVAQIAGKESAVGKAAAIASTTISTYQSATSAFNSLSGIPIVGPVLGGIAAAAAVASGLSNVQRILGINTDLNAQGLSGLSTGVSNLGATIPKGAKGLTMSGRSHLAGGETIFDRRGQPLAEIEGGENLYVLNRNASALINSLSAVNQLTGGVSLSNSTRFAQDGGMVARSLSSSSDNFNRFQELVQENINTIQVVNNPLDTIEEANNVFEVENNANI